MARPLLAIFLLGLLVRLAFVGAFVGFSAEPVTEPEPDAPLYEDLAVNLVRTGSYYQVMNGVTYRAYRSPLWPLCIAGVYKIAGGASRPAVRAFGVLLSSLAPCFLFLIARRLAVSDRVALWTGLYAALYPFFVFYAGLYLTETLYITLLYATLLALLYAVEELRAGDALLAGLLIGLTALARPVAYPMVGFAALALLLRHGFARRAAVALLLIAGAAGVTVAPWFIRNHALFGAFIPGDTHGGNTLFGAYNHGLLSHPEMAGSWYLPAPGEVPPAYRYDPLVDDELTQDRKFYALGKRFIGERPDLLPWLVTRRFARFFSAWPSGALYRKLVSLLFYGLLLPFALWGAWLLRRRWRDFVVVHLVILQTLAVSLAIVASVRMRNPIDGFLILFAMTALERWLAGRAAPGGGAA